MDLQGLQKTYGWGHSLNSKTCHIHAAEITKTWLKNKVAKDRAGEFDLSVAYFYSKQVILAIAHCMLVCHVLNCRQLQSISATFCILPAIQWFTAPGLA